MSASKDTRAAGLLAAARKAMAQRNSILRRAGTLDHPHVRQDECDACHNQGTVSALKWLAEWAQDQARAARRKA